MSRLRDLSLAPLAGADLELLPQFGLRRPGVFVDSVTQIGVNTYRVTYQSSRNAGAGVRVVANGRDYGLSPSGSTIVRIPEGEALQLTVSESGLSEAAQWPQRITLQWYSQRDVQSYEVINVANGRVLAELRPLGARHMRWTGPVLTHGEGYQYRVDGLASRDRRRSTVLEAYGTMITVPSPASGVIAYDGSGTLTATVS